MGVSYLCTVVRANHNCQHLNECANHTLSQTLPSKSVHINIFQIDNLPEKIKTNWKCTESTFFPIAPLQKRMFWTLLNVDNYGQPLRKYYFFILIGFYISFVNHYPMVNMSKDVMPMLQWSNYKRMNKFIFWKNNYFILALTILSIRNKTACFYPLETKFLKHCFRKQLLFS